MKLCNPRMRVQTDDFPRHSFECGPPRIRDVPRPTQGSFCPRVVLHPRPGLLILPAGTHYNPWAGAIVSRTPPSKSDAFIAMLQRHLDRYGGPVIHRSDDPEPPPMRDTPK